MPDELLLPKKYFDMFIGSAIIRNIVQQTNLYSVQKKGVSIMTNTAEIEQFISIHLFAGNVKMPSYRLYWSDGSRYPQ